MLLPWSVYRPFCFSRASRVKTSLGRWKRARVSRHNVMKASKADIPERYHVFSDVYEYVTDNGHPINMLNEIQF